RSGLGQVPGPDDRRAGRVGVGRFMAEDEGGHGGALGKFGEFARGIGEGAASVTRRDLWQDPGLGRGERTRWTNWSDAPAGAVSRAGWPKTQPYIPGVP